MNYFIFSDTDTTLYQASGSSNAGLDEILEIRKTMSISGGNIKVSRILMKFDLGEISGSIVNGTITNPKFYLNLYDAGSENLSTSQSLWAYPVSQSWAEGEGFKADSPPTTDGASWNYKDNATDKTQWYGPLTGSDGTWFTSVYASQSLEYETRDIRMDVTPIVNSWLDGTYTNEGFIVKRSGSFGNGDTNTDEGSTKRLGNLSFFSR